MKKITKFMILGMLFFSSLGACQTCANALDILQRRTSDHWNKIIQETEDVEEKQNYLFYSKGIYDSLEQSAKFVRSMHQEQKNGE